MFYICTSEYIMTYYVKLLQERHEP